jgi:hypothetical protein
MATIPKRKKTLRNRPETGSDIRTKPAGSEPARRQASSVEGENRKLRRRVAALEKELGRLQGGLGGTVAWRSGGRRFIDHQWVAAELNHGDLASLYVASTRLQGTLRLEGVLAAIREIVMNLLGAEAMAVLKHDSETSTLSMIDSFGDVPAHCLDLSLGEDPIDGVAASGDCYFRGVISAGRDRGEARSPVACVPLKVDGAVWGAIVIYRLLPQKERLVALDFQLFELLSAQAGVALHCCELRGERAAVNEGSA